MSISIGLFRSSTGELGIKRRGGNGEDAGLVACTVFDVGGNLDSI